MTRLRTSVIGKGLALLGALVTVGLGQADARQAAAPQPNRLVTGKLIYVAPMPDNLDKWLQEDLRVWGRYKVTSNPEGVDLQISANVPEKQTEYRERHGVPLPKKEPKGKPQETSIDVVDWISGARLWSAALLDKKPDQNAAPPAPGPTLEFQVHGVTPDQLALKITNALRQYVEQLDASGSH
ncbi:MAG TPA: hypothetical protein VI455_14765 [Terriglobia bacterium]